MELTASEITFLNRAIPYIEKGMTVDEALRAVLKRDQEITSISMDKTRTGEAIRKGLAAQTYHEIRGQRAMEKAVIDAINSDMNWR